MAKKFAADVNEGDTLEHVQGAFKVLRVVVNGDQVSIRGIVKGFAMSPWATYNAMDVFNAVTVH